MGHNHVVSGNPKSTGIPQVDGLSTGPPDLGCHINFLPHLDAVICSMPMIPVELTVLGCVSFC